jgi:predicted DNA-binding protein YlxM (UPF0122 family)
MGFADMSIAEVAEDYNLSVEKVLQICDRLKISYQDADTKLALEDVKAIILAAQTELQSS